MQYRIFSGVMTSEHGDFGLQIAYMVVSNLPLRCRTLVGFGRSIRLREEQRERLPAVASAICFSERNAVGGVLDKCLEMLSSRLHQARSREQTYLEYTYLWGQGLFTPFFSFCVVACEIFFPPSIDSLRISVEGVFLG